MMFGDIFYFILNMSITAALIVLIIFLLKVCLGRFLPKSAFIPLWGIVILRFIVPVSVQSRFSILNLIKDSFTKTVRITYDSAEIKSISMLNSVQAAKSYFPVEYKAEAFDSLFKTLGTIWLAVFLLLALSALFLYILSFTRLRKSLVLKDGNIINNAASALGYKKSIPLYTSSRVYSPVVSGITSPYIAIPSGIPEAYLNYVLLHELMHIKRLDNLWKLLSISVVCIHWFNPFAWLFLYLLDRDIELACDERVLKAIGNDNRKNYALALTTLAAEQKKTLPSAGFSQSAIKVRIHNIINFRRISVAMSVAMTLLCILLFIFLATNPAFMR